MQSENKMIPVIPSRNAIVFPGRTIPMTIGRPKSVAALEEAMKNDSRIVIVAQREINEGKSTEIRASDLYDVGTLCKIDRVRGSADQGGYQILVTGIDRVQIRDFANDPFITVVVEALPDFEVDNNDFGGEAGRTALLTNIKSVAQEILGFVPADTKQLEELVDSIDDLPLLIAIAAEHFDIPLQKRQELFAERSLHRRGLAVLEMMTQQRESMRLQSSIREKVASRISKVQREQLLREHLKTIREELGEGSSEGEDNYESNGYEAKIAKSQMPEAARKIAVNEAKRLESMGSSSPESHIIRNYLDLLLAMPWGKTTPEKTTEDANSQSDTGKSLLDDARRILDADHYGLEKVKRRILQHLAVMKLKKSTQGSIILLVGPPGVGKTSLGQSIATTMGRNFGRVALGGVRDDSEIRGHRRTYIGAMPGRIVQAIKRAGVCNPVLLLDEVDKLGRGYGGDPAAALLEVLDPEQNPTFTDHYLDTEFDLSQVFFIATANSLEGIPAPLLDRMEVIEVSGYTTAEKLRIAKNHLIPKQLTAHGLRPEQVNFGDEAILRIITNYTREAGVRELQRLIAGVCRVVAESLLANTDGGTVKVDQALIEDALGLEKYLHEVTERLVPPGVVTGLAWTPSGGDILFIEASLMPGTNQLIITGQLGDVMKESAQIALSLVRANLPALVPGFVYEKKDLHIHVPAGAIPKDGPSAGITMLTTIASLFSGRSVSPKLAMTGEITLRGAVMPVGGIKEKLIAAHRAGVEKVLLPKRNQKDLRDVPEEVRSHLQIEFVETAAEVLTHALGLTPVIAHDRPLLELRQACEHQPSH